jgi:hypothetical protein
MNQQQQYAIECLREENRTLRAQLGRRRLRFTDDQRRSLAAKARLLGRRALAGIATVVTPGTLLRWHRKLIADKYDGVRVVARAAQQTAAPDLLLEQRNEVHNQIRDLFETASLKLSSVVNDQMGVTGRGIAEALMASEIRRRS